MSKRDQIIAHYEKKIAEYESRMNAAERLLLDLTPGGSEFHGSPERCAQWAQDRISFTGKLAAQRNQLRTATDALAAAMEAVEWVEGYCPWCWGWKKRSGHAPDCQRQIALRQYEETSK